MDSVDIAKWYETVIIIINGKYEAEERTAMNEMEVSTHDVNQKNILNCYATEDFRNKVFPFCQKAENRWKIAFNQLVDFEETNKKGKTIKNGIIKEIFDNADEGKRIADFEFGTDKDEKGRTAYERLFKNKTLGDFKLNANSLSIMAGQEPSRGTIRNWNIGKTVPADRDHVIKLAFWARYDISETNKLLENAGMHQLYIKGKGKFKSLKNSLTDVVYIYMISHGLFSFRKAQMLIKEMNIMIEQERAKIATPQKYFQKSYDLYAKLIGKHQMDDEGFMMFIKENVDSFSTAYNTFYSTIVKEFKGKYGILKFGKKYNPEAGVEYDLDEGIPKTYINELAGKWKDNLSELLYTAYNLEYDYLDTDYHSIQRKEIIVIALILNLERADIDRLLKYCGEQGIYGRNVTESLIYNATENAQEISIEDLVESLYVSRPGDPDNMKTLLINSFSKYPVNDTAVRALQTYGWIKYYIEEGHIEEESKWLLDLFPEKELFEYLVTHEELEDAE